MGAFLTTGGFCSPEHVVVKPFAGSLCFYMCAVQRQKNINTLYLRYTLVNSIQLTLQPSQCHLVDKEVHKSSQYVFFLEDGADLLGV